MVFSPRKKEIRPIQIQIFILTHYKKNLHLQSDLFINTIFIVTSSNSTCTSRPTCTFFFSSRPTCTSPMVGQRSAQGGLEWSTVPNRMRTRWLQCTRLKISGTFSNHASIVNEVSEFILKRLDNKSPIVKQNV